MHSKKMKGTNYLLKAYGGISAVLVSRTDVFPNAPDVWFSGKIEGAWVYPFEIVLVLFVAFMDNGWTSIEFAQFC